MRRSVPVWLSWLKYLSWFLYGFEALLINQWEGVKDISCIVPSIDQNSDNFSCMSTGEEVLDQLAFEQANFWRDILMLVVLAVGLRIMAFIALFLKARRKQ